MGNRRQPRQHRAGGRTKTTTRIQTICAAARRAPAGGRCLDPGGQRAGPGQFLRKESILANEIRRPGAISEFLR